MSTNVPKVVVRLPSGEEQALFHGDLIGRLWSAALHLNDGRVSECHAMISLRGRELRLLALRGRFAVHGKVVTSAVLYPGLEVLITPGLALSIVRVDTPDEVLAVSAPGLAERVVPGVMSLFGGPRPRVEAGWSSSADGHLWPTGDGWMRSGEPPVAVVPGSGWTLRGAEFRTSLHRDHPGVAPTARAASFSGPLTLIARYDSAHIQRDGREILVINGRSARLLSELAVINRPVGWETLARELWGDLERNLLRRRWDVQVVRLRKKLIAAGLSADLIRSDGSGLVELVLRAQDTVVDET